MILPESAPHGRLPGALPRFTLSSVVDLEERYGGNDWESGHSDRK